MTKTVVNTDERLEQLSNKIQSKSFLVLGLLLSLDIMYRMFYLGQQINQYFDIFVILNLGNAYWLFTGAAKGIVSEISVKLFKYGVILGILMLVFAAAFIKIYSDTESGIMILVIGIPCIIAVFGLVYLLSRHWSKKNNFEE